MSDQKIGDVTTPVDDLWVDAVCKPGEGAVTCRYLGFSGHGWGCLKLDKTMRPVIVERAPTMKSKGDNCTGRAPQKS